MLIEACFSKGRRAMRFFFLEKETREIFGLMISTKFLQAFEPPIDMSQDIDINENENQENVLDGYLQTQTAHNYQGSSAPLGHPINGTNASGPGSSYQGVSNVACEPFGRSNATEVYIL